MKKVSMLMCAFMVASAISVPVFAADTVQSASPAVVSSTGKTAAPKATKKALKDKFADLISQAKKLSTDSKSVGEKNKAVSEQIKSQRQSLKESLKSKSKAERKAYQANLKTQLSPIQASIKSLEDEVSSLRDQKKTQVSSLKDAYKAKDESKISSALNSIIGLQKQIVEKDNLISDYKAKILGLLK